MSQIISITDLRKDLFKIADMVAYKGVEVDVEKEGRRIIKLVRIDDDPKKRAQTLLTLLPSLAGMWRNIPNDTFKKLDTFLRGKKEKRYIKQISSSS